MYCAIDFGTSNSAIAVSTSAQMELVELEAGQPTMPTAVFYYVEGSEADGPPRAFGRAAVAAYVEGADGRLMRSMKSILGSDLVEQTTDVGGGRGVRYGDMIAGYLLHLKRRAEAHAGTTIDRAMLGRPVFFVDDDPVRDARAEAALHDAARMIGFKEVRFQYEPIAAAFDYERQIDDEQVVLVADIGGGTSDFSVVRVGPGRAARADRKDDILANHGVHLAGTDFDRRVELRAVLPAFGFGALGPATAGASPRAVPSGVYFDLATWHLINTVYSPARVAELRAMRRYYGQPIHHQRLMTVVEERLGHELLARAEQGKIDVAGGGATRVELDHVERGLHAALTEADVVTAIEEDVARIVGAAREAVVRAGLGPDRVAALYFTGGSTGLRLLADRIAAAFPGARVARGDRYTSVASGLALHARRTFGA